MHLFPNIFELDYLNKYFYYFIIYKFEKFDEFKGLINKNKFFNYLQTIKFTFVFFN